MKHFYLIFVGLALASCSNKLVTTSVGYQSVRTLHSQPTSSAPIPDEAKIVVAYSIGSGGDLTAIVYNRTSEIMTIDQTKSFFVNSNGKSIYDYFEYYQKNMVGLGGGLSPVNGKTLPLFGDAIQDCLDNSLTIPFFL